MKAGNILLMGAFEEAALVYVERFPYLKSTLAVDSPGCPF